MTVSQRIAAPGTMKVTRDRTETITGMETIQVISRLHFGGLLLTEWNMVRMKRIISHVVEMAPKTPIAVPKTPKAEIKYRFNDDRKFERFNLISWF